ncbi:TerB family tellurite resistance protein [Lentibacter sp. XHP0401]|jgi:uncharacterized tellurite resistance protein B-like protein|uniref:tellurite resistance TerB family protein n=1 Tax=Lentibacter sp. XHP0401 TaxID=2984334 RepID=UPI0021E7187A|nr:TerB family tellurite resistance protein [Lentibacter sp. XHP0401]MCV2891735.1 TerB family tellurite resistance protein [Lentibacter sp. XHP0401]
MEIIDRIMARFHKTAPVKAPLPEPDANMALVALMIRVAKADKSYAVEEIAKIDKLITELFGLNPVQAAKMRATCEKLEAAAPHEGKFAKLIHDSLDADKRLDALRALHSIMRADGVERPEEENVLIETSVALGFQTLPADLSRNPDPL